MVIHINGKTCGRDFEGVEVPQAQPRISLLILAALDDVCKWNPAKSYVHLISYHEWNLHLRPTIHLRRDQRSSERSNLVSLSMIGTLLARWRTPVFSNTGSTARDHLASERTFLAWIRTGLGFIALGIAVERFSQLDLDTLTKAIQRAASSDRTRKLGEPQSNSDTPLSSSPDVSRYEAILVPTLLGTGTGSIVYGSTRYFTNLRLIQSGLFKPAYHGVAILSVTCAAMAGAAYSGMLREEVHRNKIQQNAAAESSNQQNPKRVDG